MLFRPSISSNAIDCTHEYILPGSLGFGIRNLWPAITTAQRAATSCHQPLLDAPCMKDMPALQRSELPFLKRGEAN
jgi:hypothetical protein